ncbi:MAG: hypothetical protein CMA10_02640 [Euryarchaeota archaeon]|nr:hypothetical protein [Euryarchaeota archaeon]
MRSYVLVFLLLSAACIPFTVSGAEGRSSPNCLTQTIDNLAPTIDIDPGVCVIIDLGTLTPGDVYAVDLVILDDELDVLFFDENTIQPYEMGQSYRSIIEEPASTESALGGYEFHWAVPPSIQAKKWYMVLDNLAHHSDGGDGDQGGIRAKVSASVAPLQQTYWTPYNDLVAVDQDKFSILLSGDDLRLDAGTTVVVSAWDLEFIGDVYLQTRLMHQRYELGAVGVQYIDGGALQNIDVPKSVTWMVPNDLDGEELLLVVDNTDVPLGGGNGSQDLRLSVRIELAPPLTPKVINNESSTVSIGEEIQLDGSQTPNRLGQIASMSWDFDDTVDVDDDGNFSNDGDGSGLIVSPSWATPGVKTVTATTTSPTGDQGSKSYDISVVDTQDPVARISSTGTPISEGWKTDRTVGISMNCLSSSDDDAVSSCLWKLDGATVGNDTTLPLLWDDIGVHELELIVSDAAGNTNATGVTIRSVDPTVPAFNSSLLADFPGDVYAGDSYTFIVEVEDAYDGPTALRVHWDLNPTKDSDGNGDVRDDPDLVGLQPNIAFDDVGSRDIVVTVFDASNNSASYAFKVQVNTAPSTVGLAGPAMMVLFVFCLTGAVSVLGFRSWQRRLAVELLTGRGLSEDEAKGHIGMVAQRRNISLFAKAPEIAGLDQGEIKSKNDAQVEAKAAEMEALYGSSQQIADPNLSFAPPAYQVQEMSQGSSQAAIEAASLFDLEPSQPAASTATSDAFSDLMDDELTAATPAPPSENSNVESQRSAVQLPPIIMEPEPMPEPVKQPVAGVNIRHTCASCNAVFEIDMPVGVETAIVGCPACGVDQTINAHSSSQ